MNEILPQGESQRAKSGAHPIPVPNGHTSNGAPFTVATVAEMLGLKEQPNGKWHGAPNGTSATKDGFVLCPEGNAFTNGGEKYTSRQVAELAGINPDEYAPIAEWKAQSGHQPTSTPRTPTNGAQSPSGGKSASRFDWDAATKFDYWGENGEPHFQVGRIGDGAAKRISQRRIAPEGWVYGLGAGWYEPDRTGREWFFAKDQQNPKAGARQLPEAKRVLWMLRDVLKAEIVHIHEGEKAAARHNDDLRAAGRYGREVATTNPHGAGKWRGEYAQALTGRHVVVWPDNDVQGRKHAEVVCASCAKVAASVKQIPTEGQPEKGDVCERFDAGITLDELTALSEATPAWTPSAAVEPTPTPERKEDVFETFTFADMENEPRARWLVRSVIREGQASLLSGDTGSFKSFFELEMALCIATGTPFFGLEVLQGAVVYIAAEGYEDLKDRAKAWAQERGVELPSNFHAIRVPVNVGDMATAARLIRTVQSVAPVLIVLDTLSQNALGLKENSNDDMALFVAGMMHVGAAVGAHVQVVHHNGRESGVFRGAGAIKYNVHTHITLERPEGDDTNTVFVHNPKQKGKTFAPFALRGEEVVVAGVEDEYGDAITSLVFHVAQSAEIPTAKHANAKKADKTRERLLEIFDEIEGEHGGVKIGTWKGKVEEAQIPKCGDSTFWAYRKKLENEGVIEFFDHHNGSELFRRAKKSGSTPITPTTPKSENEVPGVNSNNSNNPLGVGVVGVGGESAANQSRTRPPKNAAAHSEPYAAPVALGDDSIFDDAPEEGGAE